MASPSNKRLDDFRVCALEYCREALRRGNVVKPRRSIARQRAHQPE